MADVRGLADGFLAGFNTMDNALQRREESELRRLMVDQQQKNDDRRFGLAQTQFDHGKETDNRNFAHQASRDKITDQQWGLTHTLNAKNADRSYALQAQSNNLAQQRSDFQVNEQKRKDRLDSETPTAKAAWDRLGAGIYDDESLRLMNMISDDNPLSPKRLFGPDKIQTVRDISMLMPKVNDGSIDYDDPAVIRVGNTVLSDLIQRNVGETDPQTGKVIKNKELAHWGLTEDQRSIIPTLKITYGDGTTAMKPMTKNGSSDERDDSVAAIPIESLYARFRGYSQMVGAANDPRLAQFMNSIVNPPDKTAVREEAKDHRAQTVKLTIEESKAISANPENEKTIRAQFAQARSQLDAAFGITASSTASNSRINAQLNQWAAGDPDKLAFAQAALSSGKLSGDATTKELDDNYSIAKKDNTQKQNSQVAQQLRERNQTPPPAYPPYYTGK
ncbi:MULTISPECIES: hypothetical protein [Pectobacterium]|uniref:Uncharacterized protein n=1 Tax=Pectobacterium parvum TaxID=2778550 RepID=A0AAP9IM35_9GAMM|nr:hypothetical protein [Pectobacterium parvum]QHQ25833.1 hypothetical protein GMX10_18695 [Pectobacterium parvum]